MTALAPKVTPSVSYEDVTHKGFGDESSWNQNRYRSIGLVTAPTDLAYAAGKRVATALVESGVREFAWKDLTTAKRRFAAEKIVDHVVELASLGQIG